MTVDIHIWRLRSRLRALNLQLREERRRLHPDALKLQDLQRRRLQLSHELGLAEAAPAGAA